MKTRLKNLVEKISSSYWFVPSTMAVGAIGISQLLLYLDQILGQERFWEGQAFLTTGIEGARSTLATIASSMITVTGVVFSITIVSLSLASQQFGPRLLQHFMRDRGNQVVLGTVTSTFLYCLLVLRTISASADLSFVPHGCVLFAVILAVVNVGVLIYFIHHTAEAIQVTNVIRRVSTDLTRAVRRLYPKRHADEDHKDDRPRRRGRLPEDFKDRSATLSAASSGYLQASDDESLVEEASRNDLVIRLLRRPGHFIVAGTALAEIYPGDKLDADRAAALNNRFILGSKRSQENDLEFLVNELVEIAARALSPGVNDPFTAIACIDHMSAALCDLAQRTLPPAERFDSEGALRVIAYQTGFKEILDAAFNQIRQYASRNASVTIRLLESLRTVMAFTWNEDQREAIIRQAIMIEKGSINGLPEKMDCDDVSKRSATIFRTLRDRRAQEKNNLSSGRFGLTKE